MKTSAIAVLIGILLAPLQLAGSNAEPMSQPSVAEVSASTDPGPYILAGRRDIALRIVLMRIRANGEKGWLDGRSWQAVNIAADGNWDPSTASHEDVDTLRLAAKFTCALPNPDRPDDKARAIAILQRIERFRAQSVRAATQPSGIAGPTPEQIAASEEDAALAAAQQFQRVKLNAALLWAAGRKDDAIALASRGIDLARVAYGERHPEYAASIGNVAALYEAGGEYAKAEPLFQQATEIRKHVLGEHHPEYIQSVDSLATLYDIMGNHAKAKETRMQALGAAFGEPQADYAKLLSDLAKLYQAMGECDKAEPLFRQAIEDRKDILGERHPEYATSLNNLATLYIETGDYAKAEPLYRQVIEIRKNVLGERHPDYATTVNDLATLYARMGDYVRAEPLLRQAMEIRRQLGEWRPDYADSLLNLGALRQFRGDYASAEPLFHQAMEIYKQALGERHPRYAAGVNNLAMLYMEMGDYSKAEPLCRQAMEITREALGTAHRQYAASVDNMAEVYQHLGDYARAEPLFLQALEIRKQVLGERHPDYATGLNNLALLYQDLGDNARSEPLFRQALEIRKQTLGDRHPDYAESLDSLASLCAETGDYAKAAQLYLQALEIRKEVLGDRHPQYAASLSQLAVLCCQTGDYARAEPLFQQALEIRKHAMGEQNPVYAGNLDSLAMVYFSLGDYSKAEPLFRQAMEIRRQALGERHSDYATSLNHVAALNFAMGNDSGAELLERQALGIASRQLEIQSAMQSERQQLANSKALEPFLCFYLSTSEKTPATTVYDEILSSKGAITLRQRQMRQAGGAADSPLRRDLDSACRLLSVLTSHAPSPAELADPATLQARQERIDRLSDQVETLQHDLALVDADYRRSLAQTHRTCRQLAEALPADAVLLDLRQYHRARPRKNEPGKFQIELSIVAFITRAGQPVTRVELGPVEPVAQQVQAWLEARDQGKDVQHAGLELRRLIWQPILELARLQIEGATTILVSLDGPLCRFPLGALPGSKPGTYLIEEVAIADAPIPAALPELLGQSPSQPASGQLLLVGGVDFDLVGSAPASRSVAESANIQSVPRGDNLRGFGALPGTAAEVADVADCYAECFPTSQPKLLTGPEASKPAVREALQHSRYAHLATHGFFAPESFHSALEHSDDHAAAFGADVASGHQRDIIGYHPGLLSGLAFAGANHIPHGDMDDGILTALEAGELDLHNLDLAVLSACDTGLGRTAGGEGLMGLQRAFQIAGTRTVVASLWKVDDEATQKLMSAFYRNLWQKKMPKLAALRQAQLDMLHGKIPIRAQATRGLGAPEPATTQPAQPSPNYWAAFVLSGDWR